MSKEKNIIKEINGESLDFIQVKISIPNSDVKLITDIVKNFTNILEISSFKLKNETNFRKSLSIINIIRNQLEIFNFQDSIYVNKARYLESENLTIENFESDENITYEEIENDTISLNINIHIKKFLNDIIKFRDIDLNSIIDFNPTYSDSKCKTIISLINYLLKVNNYSNGSNFILEKLNNHNLHNIIVHNIFTYKIGKMKSMNNIDIDFIYRAIIHYLSIIFGFCGLRLNYIQPLELFISTPIKITDTTKERFYTNRDIMPTVNCILDYSQASMDIINGIVDTSSSSLEESVKTIYNNYHKSILPIGFTLKDNYNNLYKDNPAYIDYRGMYKPHGTAYVDGGYAFFKIEGTIKKEYYSENNYNNNTKFPSYANLLNPIMYNKYLKDKIDKLDRDETIFAFTYKVSSLKDSRFDLLNKSYVPLVIPLSKNDTKYFKEENYFRITESIFILQSQLLVPINQILTAYTITKDYMRKVKADSFSYFNLTDITSFAIQRFLYDPIKLVKIKSKNARLIPETIINKTLDYFVNCPLQITNDINIIKCMNEVLTIINSFIARGLINHDFITDISQLGVSKKYSIIDILNLIDQSKLEFKDQDSRLNLLDYILMEIVSYLPKNIATYDIRPRKGNIQDIITKLFTYITDDSLKIKSIHNNPRYSRLYRFIERCIIIDLRDKNYISKIEANKLLERSKSDWLDSNEIVFDGLVHFDPYNIDENILIFVESLEDSLKVIPFNFECIENL